MINTTFSSRTADYNRKKITHLIIFFLLAQDDTKRTKNLTLPFPEQQGYFRCEDQESFFPFFLVVCDWIPFPNFIIFICQI